MTSINLCIKILFNKMYKNWSCLRAVLIISIIFMLFLLIEQDVNPIVSLPIDVNRKNCYTHQVKALENYSKSVEFFEDLIASDKQPKPSQSIFFVSSNCSDVGLLRITQRSVQYIIHIL